MSLLLSNWKRFTRENFNALDPDPDGFRTLPDGARLRLGRSAYLGIDVRVEGKVVIEDGAYVYSGAILKDGVTVEKGAIVESDVVVPEGTVVASGCRYRAPEASKKSGIFATLYSRLKA